MTKAQIVVYGTVGRGLLTGIFPEVFGEEIRRGDSVDVKVAKQQARDLVKELSECPTDCCERLHVRVEGCG